MMIPAERKAIRDATSFWVMGIALGVPVPDHPILTLLLQIVAVLFWAFTALLLWTLTDPVWRMRERASYLLSGLADVLRALASDQSDAADEIRRFADRLHALKGRVH